MTVTDILHYRDNETALQGYLAYDDAIAGTRPGVILAPEAPGPSGGDAREEAEDALDVQPLPETSEIQAKREAYIAAWFKGAASGDFAELTCERTSVLVAVSLRSVCSQRYS